MNSLLMKITAFVMAVMTFVKFLPAQESPRFPEGVEEAAYRYRTAEGLPQVAEPRVAPPHWWAGLDWPELQLLVYDGQIGTCEVTLDYPGLQLESVDRVQNANYLFLNLRVSPSLQPGTAQIRLSCGSVERSIPYTIKAAEGIGQPAGIGPEDFIYLIMPDRFANGDTGNDVVPGTQQTGIDRANVFFRHGGDLIGIMEHLDYLEGLGVTAIWLNPVLACDQPYESYHGYATTDHYQIDPRLGTNQQYQQLVDLCHERGIKVIMDIVHNHVGDQHWMIKDLPEEDWIHQGAQFEKTTYRAPTIMDPYAAPEDRSQMLDGWFDRHMPDLNQQNPRVARYLLQNNIWWVAETGQDGYRIDTYPYPDPGFMSWWAAAMQQVFPGIGLFGETWVHGPAVQAQFTQGNNLQEGYNAHLPGVTDFQMHYAMLEALQQGQGWTSGVARLYYTLAQDFLYEDPYRNVLFLDNHDLTRIFIALGGELEKYKSAMALLMTLRGIPMIYYGTEILMTGEPGGAFGEGGRIDFPGGWPGDKVDKFKKKGRTAEEQEAFSYVRSLAQYRKENPVLHRGKLMQYVPEDGVYVYFRYDVRKTVMVVYNANEAPKAVSTSRFARPMQGYASARDIATGDVFSLLSPLQLPAHGALVLELLP
ncbi:glycoside hydrolase family 13 protein [Phaeodactylibacter luteus]|nr:glycoside hydrolase family 13 protein [Phaeodactylibacter luteus]